MKKLMICMAVASCVAAPLTSSAQTDIIRGHVYMNRASARAMWGCGSTAARTRSSFRARRCAGCSSPGAATRGSTCPGTTADHGARWCAYIHSNGAPRGALNS